MRPFSTSTRRLQLLPIVLTGSVAIIALLAIAVLVVAVGLGGSGSRPGWTKLSALLSGVGTAQPDSGNREQAGPGLADRDPQGAGLAGSGGTGRTGGFAAIGEAIHPEQSDASDRLIPASPSGDDAFLLAALERLEQQIAAAMARARESVVSLEYTASDAPTGTRRIATGVVINHRGEMLSVKIDPTVSAEPAGTGTSPAPILARDYSGRRYVAHWIAADPETGLTLLQVAPSRRATDPRGDRGPKSGRSDLRPGQPVWNGALRQPRAHRRARLGHGTGRPSARWHDSGPGPPLSRRQRCGGRQRARRIAWHHSQRPGHPVFLHCHSFPLQPPRRRRTTILFLQSAALVGCGGRRRWQAGSSRASQRFRVRNVRARRTVGRRPAPRLQARSTAPIWASASKPPSTISRSPHPSPQPHQNQCSPIAKTVLQRLLWARVLIGDPTRAMGPCWPRSWPERRRLYRGSAPATGSCRLMAGLFNPLTT